MARISNKEMQQSIFSEQGKDQAAQSVNNDILYYVDKLGANSESDLLTNDKNKALAKKTIDGGRASYYIKTNGSNFYNPFSMYPYSHPSGVINWRFEEVNNKKFDLYLTFLRTGVEDFLNLAERE